MDILETLNELRKQAIAENKLRLSVEIKNVMMRHYMNKAHLIINQEQIAKAAAINARVKESGTSPHYVSRSGKDIAEELAIMTSRPVEEKKRTVVETKPDPVKLISNQAYQQMIDMSDEELDAMFKTLATEKEWLKSEGKEIHPNAGSPSTRKRTREHLESMAKAEGS